MAMKSFSTWTFLVAIAVAAPLTGALAETAYTPPAMETGQDGWSTYVDPLMLDESSTRGLSAKPDTPEGAVVLFLASRIRGDGAWEAAITADPGRRTEKGLAAWEDMTLKRAQIRERKMRGEDRGYVRVWLDLSIDGDDDEGTDDFTVVREGDGWRITELPS